MGTWGCGNLDNDGAQDYLDDLGRELAQRIEEILADEERSALDEEGESVLMPTVELLTVLYEHCHAPIPDRHTVARWKQQYLSIYNEQIGDMDPVVGFKEARRMRIEATFLKLEAQAWDREQRMAWSEKAEA